MGSKKNEGNMMQKDVMCADCGQMKTLHQDGRMEVTNPGNAQESESAAEDASAGEEKE